MNISVSFDGTWYKRGHTSLYAVGCVTDVHKGFEVLSKFFQTCEVGKKELDEHSPEYHFWHIDHKKSCERNYEGSSPVMEMIAAVSMWKVIIILKIIK